MSKKVKIAIIVLIVALIGGLISIKKSVRSITLIGMVHNTKTMKPHLAICDSRTLLEAQQACAESAGTTSTEITNLCNLRLKSETEQFNNKCLRFYRFVERAKTSQKNVSEYLKAAHYEYLILENEDSVPDIQLNPKKTAYLFKSNALENFSQKYPNYEEDISVCKDYHLEKVCNVMKEFFDLYAETIMSYLDNNLSKNAIVVIEKDHLKYLSCKDFNKRKYSCKEIFY